MCGFTLYISLRGKLVTLAVRQSPVKPIVVMEIHHDGHRLSQHYADPYYHVPNLPSGEGEGRQHPQGDLRLGRGGQGILYMHHVNTYILSAHLRNHACKSPNAYHLQWKTDQILDGGGGGR